MRWIKPELMALTRPCPSGNLSCYLEMFYFILAAHHCNGWSGAACQVPLAQLRRSYQKHAMYQMFSAGCQNLTEEGKGKRFGWGCPRRKGRGATTHQSQGGHFCGICWNREMISSLLGRVNMGIKIRELLSYFFVGMTRLTNTRVIYAIKWALIYPSYNMILLLKLELAHSSKTGCLRGMELALAAVRLEQPQALS